MSEETMNTFEKITHAVKELPNGDKLNINLFRIVGNQPGPHIHIQSSVHGAEHQGGVVIYELMKYFLHHPFKGSVTFIPNANPIALNQKIGTWTFGRFNPVTGNNWNRNYHDICQINQDLSKLDLNKFAQDNKDLEWADIKKSFKKLLFETYKNLESNLYKRGPNENGHLNLLLQKIASTSDIVLDLHTGPIACRYLYAADYTRTSAAHLDAEVTLLIPPEFGGAMDEATFVPWVKLHQAFKDLGREIPLEFEAFTVELGSEEVIEFDKATDDAARILNYLKYRGVIEELSYEKKNPGHAGFLKDYKCYTSPRGGLVDYRMKPGQIVEEGAEIARFLCFQDLVVGENLDQAVISYKAPQELLIVNHNTSASIAQGGEFFYALEKFFKI